MTEQYTRTPNTRCVVCGNNVYRRPAGLERTKGRAYCSVACYGLSCRKEKPCIVCGNKILSSMNKKTCSRACANINRAGIKYKLHLPRKDKVKDQRSIKLRLIAAKGKVCERCGYKTLEILNVHHKDRNRDNNNLNNLELLCPNCHAEEHYLEKSWLKVHFKTTPSEKS